MNDLGSGCLLDTAQFGMMPEPTVQESVDAGIGLSMFSGDKLLGGPQAGIIVGNKDLIDKMAKRPLMRALRVDKITLATLSATLLSYINGSAMDDIPVWRMISASRESLAARLDGWLSASPGLGEIAELKESRSAVGGGSLPGETLPTMVLSISPRGSRTQELFIQQMFLQTIEIVLARRNPLEGFPKASCQNLNCTRNYQNQIGSLRKVTKKLGTRKVTTKLGTRKVTEKMGTRKVTEKLGMRKVTKSWVRGRLLTNWVHGR